jgi:hypothetical protein
MESMQKIFSKLNLPANYWCITKFFLKVYVLLILADLSPRQATIRNSNYIDETHASPGRLPVAG